MTKMKEILSELRLSWRGGAGQGGKLPDLVGAGRKGRCFSDRKGEYLRPVFGPSLQLGRLLQFGP